MEVTIVFLLDTLSFPPSFRNICVCTWLLSCVQLFATPWTIACQAPLSMGFSRQEYCSGLPFSPPRDLPEPGIASCLAGKFFTTESPGKLLSLLVNNSKSTARWAHTPMWFSDKGLPKAVLRVIRECGRGLSSPFYILRH